MANNPTNVHGMNVSGSDTTPDQFGHLLRDVFAGSVAGMAVTQNGTPNMNVTVAPGTALLNKNTVSSVVAEVKTATNVVISTANASNPRIDTIIIFEDTDVTITPYIVDGTGGRFKLASVVGTPAASPTILSDSEIQADIGAGKPWARLADVTVAALTTTILNSNIADKRNPITTAGSSDGFTPLLTTPGTPTYFGNRSYSLPLSGDWRTTLSPGMRLRTTRTVAAPTQSASLNGANQYFNKTTPAGMTFTDDFTVSAWVKLSSYPSVEAVILSRLTNSGGWTLRVRSTGQIRLVGYNGSGANFRLIDSYQSLPLNKWVHVTAQLDMSAYTLSSTTCYVMLDGVDVPASLSSGGTNPTSIVQSGNLEIGSESGGISPFPGKIAQVAIFSAKVTQATMRTYISQGLAGTETSLVSAYTLSNSLTDLKVSNANNLTAQNAASTTNADSPFGGQAGGAISSTIDYAIIQSAPTYSAPNTTLVVQVPEGCTIPTNGGVSAVSYSGIKAPYGFPGQKSKWRIETVVLSSVSTSGTATATWYNPGGLNVLLPVGEWGVKLELDALVQPSGAVFDWYSTLSSSTTAQTNLNYSIRYLLQTASTSTSNIFNSSRSDDISATTAAPWYILLRSTNGISTMAVQGNTSNPGESTKIIADNNYL